MSAGLHLTPSWEHFRHGADIGVRGRGPSLAAAFEQAAMALMGVVTDPTNVRAACTVDIVCTAPCVELLLYDWLNAVVYAMATQHLLFSRFDVSIEDSKLTARAHGEPVSQERHQPAVEIKGATMTELRVVEIARGEWCAQCVVDV